MFSFLSYLSQGICYIRNISREYEKEIFENLEKNPNNKNLCLVLLSDASRDDIDIKVEESEILEIRLVLEMHCDMFLFCKMKINKLVLCINCFPSCELIHKALIRIFENEIRHLVLDILYISHDNLGIFMKATVMSKTITSINFKGAGFWNVLGYLLLENKVVTNISCNYLSRLEYEIFRDNITQNYTLTSLCTDYDGGFDLNHINSVCIRNKYIRAKKICILMMRHRRDCVISLLPRRVLIYLLSYLETS